MIFEDDETLRMYVEESKDHLVDIENDLLAIEETGEDIDEDLVNNVFRAAHSIKGGAGFMGLSKIKELAHKIENVLGMVRSREIVPTPDIISTLLRAFDTLREMIFNVETSNDMDINGHVTELVALTTASLPDDEKESISLMVDVALPGGRKVLQAPKFDIDHARREGRFIYLVEYDLIHDIQRKRKTPLDVISYLLNSGTIIQSKIDIDAVGTLDADVPSGIPFYVLFASIIEPEIIPSLFDVDEQFVHQVTDDMCSPVGAESTGRSKPVEMETRPEKKKAASPLPVATAAPQGNDGFSAEEGSGKMDSEMPEDEEVGEKQDGKPVAAGDVQDVFAEKNGAAKNAVSQASLRVNVGLLDLLMTLAGELVLSRNQLMQAVSTNNMRTLETAGQRIDMVTSELQEAIMRTRMQSIANVFNKFPRVVRDLAKELGKEVDLVIEGKNVELDKTIIEAISDPLTHLVRNAVDHGIETPEIRRGLGKHAIGRVKLSAYHEAGQVNIEISDDGKGLDGDKLVSSAIKRGLLSEQHAALMSEKEKIGLIFLPGFSTAQKVTDVSGRGVGMDVVKTNLDKLGGIVDIESKIGEGTVIRIKLPLTLAIIPSQIIDVGNERYAIPQVNLNELLRIPAAQVKNRIEKVGDANVVRLRGNLLPLLNLSQVLKIRKTFHDPMDGRLLPERRDNIADRRSRRNPLFSSDEMQGESERLSSAEVDANEITPRSEQERRISIRSAINIAVVSAGAFKYGLVVDQLRDSEEIVVKPLGRHLKGCSGYAGATIMGDGKVALILDVAGLAQMAQLTSLEGTNRVSEAALDAAKQKKAEKDKVSLLLFRNAEKEQCAVPLGLVERIERIKVANIEVVGGKKVIQYRGGSLPLFSIDQVAKVKPLPDFDQLEVVVFRLAGREVGLMVTPPVDAVDVVVTIDTITLRQTGIMGSAIIGEYTTLIIDMYEIVRTVNPEWFDDADASASPQGGSTILFAEDSAFFRNQVKGFLQEEGYTVLDAEDGMAAWEILNQHSETIKLVLTDLEMPHMDGFELTAKIKADPRYAQLKVVALTSLAGDEDIAKGAKFGIDDYQLKLDRDKLIETVRGHLSSIKSS
ncbi:MAG: chemotaxis protein CheW [Thermodesulfobacteriota bacterium]